MARLAAGGRNNQLSGWTAGCFPSSDARTEWSEKPLWSGLYQLTGYSQWPGCVVRWTGNGNWTGKGMPTWARHYAITLRIKEVHQSRTCDGNHQVTVWYTPLGWPPRAMKWMGVGGCRDALNLDIFLLHLRGTKCRHGNHSVNKKDCRAMGKMPQTELVRGSGYAGTTPVASGAINGSNQDETLYSGLSSAYQVVEANAQNTIKGLEQKCCFVVVLSFLCSHGSIAWGRLRHFKMVSQRLLSYPFLGKLLENVSHPYKAIIQGGRHGTQNIGDSERTKVKWLWRMMVKWRSRTTGVQQLRVTSPGWSRGTGWPGAAWWAQRCPEATLQYSGVQAHVNDRWGRK